MLASVSRDTHVTKETTTYLTSMYLGDVHEMFRRRRLALARLVGLILTVFSTALQPLNFELFSQSVTRRLMRDNSWRHAAKFNDCQNWPQSK